MDRQNNNSRYEFCGYITYRPFTANELEKKRRGGTYSYWARADISYIARGILDFIIKERRAGGNN